MKVPALGKFRHRLEVFEFCDEACKTIDLVRKHTLILECACAIEVKSGQRYWGAVNGLQDDRSVSHLIYIRFPTVAIDATQRVILDNARLMRIDNVTNLEERGRFLAIEAREERDVRTELPSSPSDTVRPGPKKQESLFEF